VIILIKKLRKVSNSKLLFMKIFQSFEIFYIVVEALRSYIEFFNDIVPNVD
jgi:hypothetical protein